MKKLLIIFLAFISLSINGQEKILSDSALFMGKMVEDSYMYKGLKSLSSDLDKKIRKNEIVFLYGLFKSEEQYDISKYYGVFYYGDSCFIPESKIVTLDRNHDYLLEKGKSGSVLRKRYAELYSLYKLDQDIEETKKLYKSYDVKGIVITKREYSHSNYQFGLKITFYNGYKKPIKYIHFTVSPYNRVGDPTFDDLGRRKFAGKVIGPLESKDEASVDFDEMFWDDKDIISCLRITSIKVVFMNGTVTNVVNVANHLGKNVANSCK